MKLRFLSWLLVILALASPLAAQPSAAPAVEGTIFDGMALPGLAWSTMGNFSPIEHNNGYSESYVEQGATVFASNSGSTTVTPYASLGLVLDSKGYPWNDKIEPRIGVKLNRVFRSGVVSVGSAYSYEDRFKSATGSGLIVYTQAWFGWQEVSHKSNRFPGSSWVVLGNISPVENGNVLAWSHISQGIVAKRFSKATLVPYGEVTLARDSKHFDWNNKAVMGTGVKAVFAQGDTYSELGAAYLEEHRFYSGGSAGGLTLFLNVSYSWNLLGRSLGR
ncbi:MAG: hypothetical protein JO356_17895 [Acidobacteria bacterium]|nr:hypothetical protein [Acidobacteriota bacterium]